MWHNWQRLMAGQIWFEDKPLVVVTASVERSAVRFSQVISFDQAAFKQIWLRMQAELSQISTNSRHLIAEKSGHSIEVPPKKWTKGRVKSKVEK